MNATAGTTQDPVTEATGACSCPPCTVPPWRTRDSWFSLASLIGGLAMIAFGVMAVVADRVPLVGWAILGVVVGAAVAALVVNARAGHRGWCLAARSLWVGVAAPGLPIRAITALAF